MIIRDPDDYFHEIANAPIATTYLRVSSSTPSVCVLTIGVPRPRRARERKWRLVWIELDGPDVLRLEAEIARLRARGGDRLGAPLTLPETP